MQATASSRNIGAMPRRTKLTLTDKLEFALAKFVGRASWPFAEATLESELTLNTLNSGARPGVGKASFSCFAYEVDGILHTSAIRLFWGQRNSYSRLPKPDRIQYNPLNPKHAYYAPAHTLTNNFIAILAIVALVFCTIKVASFQ